MYNNAESKPENPRILDLVHYKSSNLTKKSSFSRTEQTNSHATSKNIYFPQEMLSYVSNQQNFGKTQASST
jgi:hypothetical protein